MKKIYSTILICTETRKKDFSIVLYVPEAIFICRVFGVFFLLIDTKKMKGKPTSGGEMRDVKNCYMQKRFEKRYVAFWRKSVYLVSELLRKS